MKIFISISNYLEALPEVCEERISEIVLKGFDILLENKGGSNELIEQFLAYKKYKKVSIYRLTWDYYDEKTETAPTPIELTTKVNAMPDKVRQFLKEYCTEWGMTAEQYAQVVDESCVINYVKYDTMKLIPFIGIGVGVLFLIIFIIILVKGKGKTVYVNEQPPMYPPQDSPMNGGMQ